MKNWIECKVAYERHTNNGLEKVSEAYLLEAESFTEAEAGIIKIVQPLVSFGEISVTSVQKRKVADVFLRQQGENDKFYRIKIMLISYDEKDDKEKKTATAVLIQAETAKEAIERLEREYGKLENYEIHTVAETALLDVYPLNN